MQKEKDRGRTYNPGDLRLPEGFEIKPAKKVLILGRDAVRVNRDFYDEIVLLNNGSEETREEEAQALGDTTHYGP